MTIHVPGMYNKPNKQKEQDIKPTISQPGVIATCTAFIITIVAKT
jgi:hypothetical protein